MPNTDPRVDAYIARSADFAKPILAHLRELVHRASPEMEETIKWGMPVFMRNGRNVCSMAAFKAHAVFAFPAAAHMKDAKKLLAVKDSAMGHFGRISSMEDLPADKVILAYLKEAVALSEKGVKSVPNKPGTKEKKALPVPAFFKEALAKNKKAKARFEKLPPSHKREYLQWFMEAKKEETRDRRVAQALEWIAEGKGRNWQYEQKAGRMARAIPPALGTTDDRVR